jgi:predicted dehydrogenase
MLFGLPAVQSGAVPGKFPLVIVGTGATAFISSSAWWPNLLATNMYDVQYGCIAPSRPEDADWFMANARVPRDNVSADLAQVCKRAVAAQKPGQPVVACVCSPTPLHAAQICTAIDCGIKYILSDKPIVVEAAELKKIQDTAHAKKANVYITFNHRFNGPIFQMRKIVQEAPDQVASIEGAFLQDWLVDDPKNPQGDWRIRHRLCGLLDIGSHVADLISFVAGAPIAAIEKGVVESVGPFAKKKGFTDHGVADAVFGNGLRGRIEYHQSLSGHADDIYANVKLKNGTQMLWRMAWGSETLFITKTGNLDSPAGWEPHLRGHSPKFSPEVNAIFNATPGGHILGWPNYWRALFLGIAGDILRTEGHPAAKEHLPPVMQTPVPKLEPEGVMITSYIEAHDKSAQQGGARIPVVS